MASETAEQNGGPTFRGRLGDGRSAAAIPVTVRYGAAALVINAGGPSEQRWPYSRLAASTPVASTSADVVLRCLDLPGPTLFVTDKAFVAELIRRAPALSVAAERWRIMRPLLPLVGLAIAITSAVVVFDLHPSQAIARLLPERAREALGEQVIRSMSEQRRVCETPGARRALDRIVDRLVGNEGLVRPPRIRVLDWSLINAFAVPGGSIVVTRGLIQKAGSAEEVAGVIAHEIGHTIELHPETALVRAIGLTAGTQLIFSGTPGSISNLGLMLAQLSYSRSAEREADGHALRLLRMAAISKQGLADFFVKIASGKGDGRERGDPSFGDMLRTHPATEERIARVRAAPDYPATPALDGDDWRALREACGTAPAPANGRDARKP